MSENANSSGKRRVLAQGTVVSDKAQKTITVQVDRKVKHPLYGKYVKRKTVLTAHDEENTAREGDYVEVAFTRPLSKRKRWRLIRVVKAGAATIAAEAEAKRAGASEGGAG